MRLDRFLAQPLGSRSQAQGLIDAGRVRIGGKTVPKRYIVRVGDLVEVSMPQAAASGATADGSAEPEFGIAYEDDHLMVVDKPAGVVVHPARGHPSGTLVQALGGRAAGGDDPVRAGIVHRLDRDTSGLLVVAKDQGVHRALRSLISNRGMRREYLALVDGHPSSRTGTIDAPIGRDRRDRVRISLDSDVPRAARTHFEVERALPSTALLRVTLETGRTHQIRVHLAAIGYPVSGDPRYGTAGRLGLARQFLHAASLSFAHPVGGELVQVSSALPPDLKAALRRAEAEPPRALN